MNEKIVLIDGHSVLNRAYYGIPDLTNAKGLHTNAIYGFLNILFKTLEEEQAQYLAVAFDLHAPTFRHVMYEPYKGTRKPMPEELRQQVPVIKEVLAAMGIHIIVQEGYEADDILGTLAKKSEEKGLDVTVLSGDRDLLQLATEHIMIRIPKTRFGKTTVEDYHAQDVLEKYQLTPLQIIDLKALMGDTADNIPGLPGVGEKTATKILLEYQTLENAYAHVEELKPNRARESMRDHYDLAQLSKELATIHIDSPIACDLEAAKIQNFYTPAAYEWFSELEFKNFLSRFEAAATPTNHVEAHFKEIRDFAEAEELLEYAKKQEKIGVYLQEEKGEILALGLAYEEKHTPVVRAILVEGFVSEAYLLGKLEELCQEVKLVSALQIKPILARLALDQTEQLFDAGIAAYLLNPLKSSYTYDDIAREHLGLTIAENENVICYQAYVAYASVEPLTKALEETQMLSLFREIEMPLIVTLRDMERAGIQVEAKELKEYGDRLQVRIKELETIIYEQAGETFNINSPKQLGVILFEKLQLPGGKKTKTGYSTAADVLEKLAAEHGIIKDILEYRQLTKLKSTYADGLANYIQADGRIHSSFNQTITATGRISSTEPNLQNIPIRMELGRLIRKVFIPREGYVFLDADYSQIELRVLAHMSGDEMLIKAYQEAQDIHRMTASQVFHIPFDEVTDLQRRNAKAVNFGIVYGISSFGLSQDLSISRKEAAAYIESYFETYPKIKGFLDGLVEQAKEKGYVTTMFGRRRPIPELASSNFMQRSFGERIAMNSPIQGTAADIIKIAMIRVNQALKDQNLQARLLLQVHDELLIEVKKDEIAVVSAILEKEMKGAAQLAVSMEIDMHTGNSWYEAK